MARSAALRTVTPISEPDEDIDSDTGLDTGIDSRSAVLEIMLETSAYTGSCYFERLTESVARYFAVDAVFLCELTLNYEKGHVLAAHESSVVTRPADLFGKGGICEYILDQGTVVQSAAVVPFQEQLRNLRSGAFVGTTLQSQSGDPIGVVFLLHRSPMPHSELAAGVLQQLAPRIGAEIERRQQEMAMRRNESRLRMLTDRSKDVLFCYQISPEPDVQYVSPAIESIFGLPPEAFHANPNLVFEMMDAEERATLEAAFAAGSEEPMITKVNPPGGETRWVEYRDFPIKEDGKLVAVGGTVRDITRRVEAEEGLKASEHYLRSLLDLIPDTLLLVRADGEVMDYKPGEVNTGLGVPSEVKGRNLKDLMSPAIVGVLERAVRAGSRSHRVQRVQFEVPGDRPRHYDVSCLPFGDDALLLVLRDLTAQVFHEGEEQRQRLRDEIDDRVESRRRSNPYALTYREMAVLSLIVEGMADKQIADALGISIFTVNKHVGNILGKMNAASRTEAGVRAIKESLLPRKELVEP